MADTNLTLPEIQGKVLMDSKLFIADGVWVYGQRRTLYPSRITAKGKRIAKVTAITDSKVNPQEVKVWIDVDSYVDPNMWDQIPEEEAAEATILQ